MSSKQRLTDDQKNRILRHILHHPSYYGSGSKKKMIDNILSKDNKDRLKLKNIAEKNEKKRREIDSKCKLSFVFAFILFSHYFSLLQIVFFCVLRIDQ